MSTPETMSLPDYAPVPRSALGPALNEQGYYVGRVVRNLYWVTDGTYQSAFVTTADGVVLLDAPPTIGHNIQRAVDEVADGLGLDPHVRTGRADIECRLCALGEDGRSRSVERRHRCDRGGWRGAPASRRWRRR